MFTNREKRFLKRLMKKEIERRSHGDRYSVSLQDKARCLVKRDDYGYTEYGFYEPGIYTDEEIQEFLDNEYRIPAWNSQYDCTGREFTVLLDFHRNPCGWISFRHVVGIDL